MPGYSENDPQVVPIQPDLLPPGYAIRNRITPLRHHSLIDRPRVTIQDATGCRARTWFRVEVEFAHRTWLQGREEVHMGVQLNHTIVWCADKVRSASFLADILGLPAPTRFGPFQVIGLENAVSLDFHETKDSIASQHYAFLVDDERFDAVFARIRARGLSYWADPGRSK